jgi:hypothetical protein
MKLYAYRFRTPADNRADLGGALVGAVTEGRKVSAGHMVWRDGRRNVTGSLRRNVHILLTIGEN